MVATYTANLAAYLTVTLTRKPVNSLEELAQSSDITPLIQSSTNLQTLFEVMIFHQWWIQDFPGQPIEIILNTISKDRMA